MNFILDATELDIASEIARLKDRAICIGLATNQKAIRFIFSLSSGHSLLPPENLLDEIIDLSSVKVGKDLAEYVAGELELFGRLGERISEIIDYKTETSCHPVWMGELYGASGIKLSDSDIQYLDSIAKYANQKVPDTEV